MYINIPNVAKIEFSSSFKKAGFSSSISKQSSESGELSNMSAIITMSFLGFWPLAIGLFPSKKSVIVAPRNNTYYQSKCLLSWVLGGNFLASEVHDLVKKLRGREDRRERGAVIFQALTLCCYTRYILSQNRVGSEKKLYSDNIRINFRNNKLKMTREILPVILN